MIENTASKFPGAFATIPLVSGRRFTDGVRARASTQVLLRSISIDRRFCCGTRDAAEFLQEPDVSPEERRPFSDNLNHAGRAQLYLSARDRFELTDDSRSFFEGEFLGPEWADILDCLLPYLSAEQQEFWTTLRRERSGRYDYCIDRIFQQFRGVMKTTEMRDVISGEAIPLRSTVGLALRPNRLQIIRRVRRLSKT